MEDAPVQESLVLTETLNQLANLDQYNFWLYEQIAAGVGRRIIEVGAGTGNITQFLCAGGRAVLATDVVPSYRRELETIFANRPNVRVGQFDLNKAAPADYVAEGFDTVVCLNVLEHIEDDLFALEQMNEVLVPGGKLLLLVPAHQRLYGEFDRAVGHFRRYSKHTLKERL